MTHEILNHRIAIILENRKEWPMIFFGILSRGDIAVPLDPKSADEDLDYFLNHSESNTIYTSNKFIKRVASKNIHTINIDETPTPALNERLFYHPGNHDDIAVILYTSGTTGKPKGVMLTHGNLLANFHSIEKLGLFSEKHNVLSVLPFYHSFPLMVTLIIPVLSKNKITYIDDITSESIFRVLQNEAVTLLPGVPQFFQLFAKTMIEHIHQKPFYQRWMIYLLIEIGYWLRRFLKTNVNKFVFKKIHRRFGTHLKYMVSGGAKLDETIARFLTKIGFTIIEGYGLTETSPILTFNPPDKIKFGSAGKPIPDVDIKIQDGEILARGPNIMRGYYKDEVATREAIIDGWFYTGDLGYLDKDGYLFITGRKKEIIVLQNGKNISPDELEKHFLKSPYISEICVFLKNETLFAMIYPNFKYFKEQQETNFQQTIRFQIETLSTELPHYQHLMGFSISKFPLPKTRLGKLKRHEISQIQYELKEKPIAEKDLWIISSEPWKRLEKLIQHQYTEKTSIVPDDHLELDLGLDSLRRIELFSQIKQTFHVSIPDEIIPNIILASDLFFLIKDSNIFSEIDSKQKTWAHLLNTNPQKIILDKITLTPSAIDKFISRAVINCVYLFSKCYWRLKIKGLENLPTNINFILCSNHTSYLDAEFIALALPTKIQEKMFFLGFRGVVEKPFLKPLIRIAKIIPIDAASQLIDAMQASSYVLRNNQCLCVFPEGERSIDGKLKSFKSGIGILAKELNIPVIPVYIKGSFESWPRGGKFPKPHSVTIHFGKLIEPNINDNYETVTATIKKAIENLS